MRILIAAVLSLIVVATSGIAVAEPPEVRTCLDLVPHDAAAALAINNRRDLREKGDRLIEQTGIDTVRVSMLFSLVFGHLGVDRGADWEAPAAVMIARDRRPEGERKDFANIVERLVFAVPVKDADQMAKIFDVTADELRKADGVRHKDYWGILAGTHLYLGASRQATMDCIEGKRLSGELDEAARKTYADSDILLLIGTRPWGEIWKDVNRDFAESMAGEDDEEARQTARTLEQLLAAARFGLAGIRVDDGLAVSISAVFHDDPKIAEFLTTLSGGERPCDLNALPAGRVVAAFGARGEGSQNLVLVRSMLRLALGIALSPRGEPLVAERAEIVAAFGNIWKQLNGTRFALYRTASPDRHGLQCLLAMFDPDDPQQFVDGIAPLSERLNKTLSRWAPRAGLERLELVYHPRGRELDGRQFGVLELQTGGADSQLAASMQQLFGPRWNRMTVCVEGDHVLIMFGSDDGLLRAGLANIAEKRPGLGQQAAIRESNRWLEAGRQVELHLSVVEGSKMAGIIDKERRPGPSDPCEQLTSMALTIHSQRLQLDLWMPVCDMRAAARESGQVSD